MKEVFRLVTVFAALTLSVSSGINWKTIWLEPNPVVLETVGSSITYVVKGIDGADTKADLTHSPYLKISSSDEGVVSVNPESAQLVAKAPGRATIRISFSECTSLITATVRGSSKDPK